MTKSGRSRRFLIAVSSALICAAPVAAQDGEAEEIGLLAALGLQAADGKTTLSASAGATEAMLLGSDSVNEAGAIIAGLVNHQLASRPDQHVLVLTGSESANLSNLRMVRERLTAFRDEAATLSCRDDSNKIQPDFSFFSDSMGAPTTLLFSDLPGLLATSTTYAAVTAKVEERLLLNALSLNAGLFVSPASEARNEPARWQRAAFDREASGNRARFVIPSESQGSQQSSLFRVYNGLLATVRPLRACPDNPRVKPYLALLDPYLTSLNSVSEAAPSSLLARAMQLDTAISADEQMTKILRLSVETSGGTTTTRSSIWFTLGFPGAATVSFGLQVSFRLIDTTTGRVNLSGIVRCAEPFRNLRSVPRIAREAEGWRNRCTYIAGPVVRAAG